MAVDGFRLGVFRSLFSAVAEEMGATLGRSASSVNIKERKDYSCALFDAEGRMIAQAAHIPVHLGSMPLSVAAAVSAGVAPGRPVILNDPYRGGTHLPDVTLVEAVPVRGRTAFLVASRAHYSDIGGMSPGSMPLSTELYQEGLILPPTRLTPEVRSLLLANVRTPRDVAGDLDAQLAAGATGGRRLQAMVRRYGLATLEAYGRALQSYSKRWMVKALRRIPAGRWSFEDALDDDGVTGRPVRIRVSIVRRGDGVTVDFGGSAPQVAGNINAVYAVTVSSVLYAFRCLVDEDIPLNAGAAEPIRILAPAGTVVNARPPAAVAAGNVETSQRIVDVVFGALAKACPDRIPAASQGTMNNISFGGEGFATYETLAGGSGASPRGPGASAVHSHMTNTLNTPIEAFERAFPVRIREYRIRAGSGGRGRFRGGDGLVRRYEFQAPAQVSILSDRRKTGPYGLAGGKAGKAGRNRLNGLPIPGKATFAVGPGDQVTIETPGGGGFGPPR